MTPLMNTVQGNHEDQFMYLHFKEQCELNNVDLSGNTLMHIAARSNAVNIAKLLKHIYITQTKGDLDDSNLAVAASPGSGSEKYEKYLYFDLNKTNNMEQTPMFMTVQSRST